MSRDRALLLLRLASGGVFVAFGLGKFVNHGSELASFRAYGLPAPGTFVIVIGLIELVGGLLLIAGLWSGRPLWCWPGTWWGRSCFRASPRER